MKNQTIRLPENYEEIYQGEDNFYENALMTCKNDWNGFLNDVLRWSKHINAKEPELLHYVSKPEGLLLLYEWLKRMDCASMREEWMEKSSAEKNSFLELFYDRTKKIIDLSKRIEIFSNQSIALYQNCRYHDALQLIKPLVDDFENLDYIKETDNAEYFSFETIVQVHLWQNLMKCPKQTRHSYLFVTYLYYCYGWLLYKCELYQDARLALERAYTWAPISTRTVFKLAETFPDDDKDYFYKLLKQTHAYCYTKEDIAECYRGFAFVFIGKHAYRDALCCYKIGRCYSKDPDYMRSELSKIQHAYNGSYPDISIEDILESSKNKDYPIGVNREIFHIAVHCKNEFLKHGDKNNADCFLSILNEFFDDQDDVMQKYNQIVN